MIHLFLQLAHLRVFQSYLYFPDFGLKLKYFAMSQARFPSLHIFSSLLTCRCHGNAFFVFFNNNKTELKNNFWLPWLLRAVFDGVARFQTLPSGSALSARNHVIRVFRAVLATTAALYQHRRLSHSFTHCLLSN